MSRNRAKQALLDDFPVSVESFKKPGRQSYPGAHEVSIPSGSVGIPPELVMMLALLQDVLRHRGYEVPNSHFTAVLGEGEAMEENLVGSLDFVMDYGIKDVTHIVDFNYQRLDAITRDHKLRIIRGNYENAGWKVVELKRGRKILEAFEIEDGGATFKEVMDGLNNVDFLDLISKEESEIREALIRLDSRLESFIDTNFSEDGSLYEIVTDLGGHDIVTLIKALEDARDDDEPVVIIAHTIKGWGLKPLIGRVDNHSKIVTKAQMKQAFIDLGVQGEGLVPKFREGSPQDEFIKKWRERQEEEKRAYEELKARNAAAFDEEFESVVHDFPTHLDFNIGVSKLSTQNYFGLVIGMLRNIAKGKGSRGKLTPQQEKATLPVAKRLFTVAPDIAGTAEISSDDVYGPDNPLGSHFDPGIREFAAIALTAALGKSHDFFGVRLFPVLAIYEPFYFGRGDDMVNYAQYWGSSFLSDLPISGSSSSGEGVLHHAIKAAVSARAQPNTPLYDPSFPPQVSSIMLQSFLRMAQNDDRGRNLPYMRTTSLAIPQGELLKRLRQHKANQGLSDEDILEKWHTDNDLGGFRLVDHRGDPGRVPGENVTNIITTGVMVFDALKTADVLLKERGIYANVIVISNIDAVLGDEGLRNRYAHLRKLIPKEERTLTPTVAVGDASPVYLM